MPARDNLRLFIALCFASWRVLIGLYLKNAAGDRTLRASRPRKTTRRCGRDDNRGSLTKVAKRSEIEGDLPRCVVETLEQVKAANNDA
jgi:hypothetical protein